MSEYITEYIKKLTNKIKYRLYKTADDIVTDPEAEKFAENLKEEEKKKNGYTDTKIVDKSQDAYKLQDAYKSQDAYKDDPNSIMNKITKIGEQVWYYLKLIFVPILCILLSSYISNEMIMYPVPVRVIFFIFTLILCYTSEMVFVSIMIYYICKRLYQYYLDKYANLEEKQYIMPYRFAVLPVIYTKEAVGFFKGFFSYPQENEKADKRLTMIMDEYKKSLDESFPFLETVKGDDVFKKGLEKFDVAFKDIHKESPKDLTEEEKKLKENKPVENKPTENKPAANKPVENKLTENKLTANKPANTPPTTPASSMTPTMPPTIPASSMTPISATSVQLAPITSVKPIYYDPTNPNGSTTPYKQS